MDTHVEVDEVDEVAERLRSGCTRLLQILRVESGTADRCTDASLTLSEATVLELAALRPGCPMGDVARALGCALSTATATVDRLVRRALLDRERDEENRRLIRLTLTEAGRTALDELEARQRRQCASMLDVLSKDEQHKLLRLMDKISGAGAPRSCGCA